MRDFLDGPDGPDPTPAPEPGPDSASPGPRYGPDGQELRGTILRVWLGPRGHLSFAAFPGAISTLTLHAPIGWELHRDADRGVVLRSVFVQTLDARQVADRAVLRRDGFLDLGWEGLVYPAEGPAEEEAA